MGRYGATVVVNMLNAKKFFGDSAFEPWEKLQEAGVRKEEKITVRRTYGRPTAVAYKLMDKPPLKDSKDWGRVVAVVVRTSLGSPAERERVTIPSWPQNTASSAPWSPTLSLQRSIGLASQTGQTLTGAGPGWGAAHR
jgi:hypothetical protein